MRRILSPNTIHSTRRMAFCLGVLGCFLGLVNPVTAQQVSVITEAGKPFSIGNKTALLIDTNDVYTPATIVAATKFELSRNTIPVFPVVKGTIWVKFSLLNQSPDSILFIDLQYANISYLSFYELRDQQLLLRKEAGNALVFDEALQVSPFYTLRIALPKGDSATYFLKIKSKHQVLLPLFVENRISLDSSMGLQGMAVGLYMGIMLAIFLYNLFLFFSTRDTSYFVYVWYLFFLAIAQVTLSGYGFKYFWPTHPRINDYALPVTSALAGISGIAFAIFFLRTRYYTPKLNPFLFVLIAFYVASIVLCFAGINGISYDLLNIISLAGGLLLLSASWYIARKNRYKPAYFYFVAWIAFLGGIIVFVLRNLNILPYNNFTTYILYVGSAIEGILLSIALADKINILRQEKDRSQEALLRSSQENEQLVKDQNVMLERKVAERTEELQSSNSHLSTALHDLKDAQTQLVEAEKMASLGQLTAGIAHEINNPINFVKSNIKPLQLDIKDLLEVIDEYDKLHRAENTDLAGQLAQIDKLKKDIDIEYVKTEIENLMKGIQDGAERTAEIVLGLRNFSRLDESEIKTVNIHEGLESTLILLKNQMPGNIRIDKDFRANGTIECLPGKLNQVFMN
ncbi:MAG: hypothetical protein JWQ78_908, partial [Sediminibacterium sp.]|nr:hypothetical protein [Sediminibacterium sp.]